MTSLESNKRVKVYKMIQVDSEDVWDDQGTGNVEFTTIEPNDIPGILVISEEDTIPKKILLKTKIFKEDIYVKQQDTLIVWNETNDTDTESIDLAISFQHEEGCKDFWDELHEIQSRLACGIELPVPSLSNLDSIKNLFDRLSVPQIKLFAAAIMGKPSFLATFFALFRPPLAAEPSPYHYEVASYIMKRLFTFNSKEMDAHLCDNYFADILLLLDREPGSKTNHTQFITEQAKFVEVLQLNDKNFENKIHQTFRLNYLKDSAFGRIFEDMPPLSVLAGMVHANCVQLVTQFFTSDLMKTLFTKMQSPELPENTLLDCLRLVVELITYSAALATPNIVLFFQSIVSHGLFDVIQHTLAHPRDEIRKTSAMIVLHTIDFDPSVIRCYLLERNGSGHRELFRVLTTQFVQEPHYVTKTLMFEVLRGFLDMLHIGPEEVLNQMTATDDAVLNAKLEEEKTAIINIFYSEFALTLFEPLFVPPPESHHAPIVTFMKNSLCDLLATFVDHHPQQTKVFIIKHNIMPKVFVQLNCVERNMLLGPIRILRRIVGSNDKFYLNYIIENDLFAPIVELLLQNGDKYNAVNSAILDIFHYIGSVKSCRPLVSYFIENFYEKVKHIQYVQTFKNLLILNESPEFYFQSSDEKIVDKIRETNRLKYQDQEKEDSWFDSDDDFSFSPNMLVEELNSLPGDDSGSDKRKFDDSMSSVDEIVVDPQVKDSPRPKRAKFTSSVSKDLF